MEYVVDPKVISQIKVEYIQGNGSVREICEKYGASHSYETIEKRGSYEKWVDQRRTYLKSIEENALKVSQSEVVQWLTEVKERSKEEWKLITESLRVLAASGGGVDPDAINGYARARKTYDDLMRRSLGLVDPSQKLDITSNGQGLGESLVTALQKLREAPEPPKLEITKDELEKLRNAKIVDENP